MFSRSIACRANKMVLCVRTDIGMGMGKSCSQCAHAAVGVVMSVATSGDATHTPWLQEWLQEGSAKIVVGVASLEGLVALESLAAAAKLPHGIVHDAGRTEVAAGTATVLCVGPAPSELVNAITGKLKLL